MMDARNKRIRREIQKSGRASNEHVNELESGLLEIADLSADGASAIDDLMAAVCELAALIGGDD